MKTLKKTTPFLAAAILFDPVTLSEFVLEAPIVNFEVKAPGQNNLKEIADRFAQAYEDKDTDAEEDSQTEEHSDANKSEQDEPATRIRVRDLRIAGATFNYSC